MRNSFFEYYSLTDEELTRIWENSILVMDTNILLNLYRYSPSTRDDLLGILRTYSEKLWLPYQVGWEFHNNREYVIQRAYYLPDLLKEEINRLNDSFLEAFRNNHIRNPFLTYESLEKKVNKQKDSLIKYVSDRFKDAPRLLEDDVILNDLNEFYNGKVGDEFNEAELKQIYDEGAQRYALKVPPGYKDESDKKNKSPRHLYGDLIIWKEIIRKAKTSEKDIVFVSDDLKDDWLRIDSGQIKGPRRELLREFRSATGGRNIVIMTQRRFLEFIHGLPDYPVKSSTRKEVEASKNGHSSEYTLSLKGLESMYEEYKNLQVLLDLVRRKMKEQSDSFLPVIPPTEIEGVETSPNGFEIPGEGGNTNEDNEGEDQNDSGGK